MGHRTFWMRFGSQNSNYLAFLDWATAGHEALLQVGLEEQVSLQQLKLLFLSAFLTSEQDEYCSICFILVCVCVCVCVSERETARSLFNFLRSCQTFPKCLFWASPHPYQHLSVQLIIAIPVYMNWYLTVVCISIFLMTNDVKHLFKCLLTVYLLWRIVYPDPWSLFGLYLWVVMVLCIFWK